MSEWPGQQPKEGTLHLLPKAMLLLRLLTWDVKDTLLQLRLPVGECYSAAARSWGLEVSPRAMEAAFHQAHRERSQRFPNYGRAQGMGCEEWWLGLVHDTFRRCGLAQEVDAGLLGTLAEQLYRDYSRAESWEPLPGALETLRQLQEAGLPMAAVSNFDRRLAELLHNCGLRGHFSWVLNAEEAGFAKPDPRIFLEALRLSGADPGLAAHVGDDYEHDYRAARQAGMHAFLLAGTGTPPAGVPRGHLLESLSQLPSRIGRA
ncbi:haloacid dehalogenase-like hydrolase domain-containing protein 3 isoform X1 [Anolis sagrei]|uniref:haloacid dehalogenase-like hydrolase domain-containing protein 3 isoform X1 n=2 Tax=Anolis sagrei TaxID=38937 RepID=UPI0035211B92